MSVQRMQAPGNNGQANFLHMMELAKPKLATIATKYLGEERLCALAISMWNKDSRLRQCSPQSFLLALYKACQLGLDPTGIGNQGHIVAYRGEAQFIRGWGGVITQAARQGINIDTFAVYESDEFEVARYVNSDGYHLGLHHVEKRDDPESIGGVRAAYAVASCKDWDQPMIEVVWRHDIEKIRSNSASPNSPAWKSWYSEMARKTAVNRLAKRLPLFVEVKVIKENEGGRPSVVKEKISISAIPNEDTYYEGRVGNPVIDAPIDGGPESVPEQGPSEQLVAISKAMELRQQYPDAYSVVVGRKDITKMGKDALLAVIEKIQEVGDNPPVEESQEEVEEQLGF